MSEKKRTILTEQRIKKGASSEGRQQIKKTVKKPSSAQNTQSSKKSK